MKQFFLFGAALALVFDLALSAGPGEIMPAPQALLAAKKAYLVDQTGDTKVADRVYAKLKKWGRWEMVADEPAADIVLVLGSKVQNFGAFATSQTLNGYGSATAFPLYSDKRFLSVFIRDSPTHPVLSVNAEAWVTPGTTAGRLVSRLRERIERSEK